MEGGLTEAMLVLIRESALVRAVFAVVLVVVVAKVVAPVVIWIIRTLAARTKTTLDDEIIEIARPPIYGSLVLGGLAYAMTLFALAERVVSLGASVLWTAGIAIWTPALVRIVRVVFANAAVSENTPFINEQTRPLFVNVSAAVIVMLAVYFGFIVWGINLTAWLAGAGVAGIAIGFAAKDTLANLISGVFILADAPYKVGDMIVLDSGERGTVTNIGLRSTRILTRTDTEITIPNSVMNGSKIVNETGGPHKKFRVSATVGASYDADPEHVERVLLEVAKNEELVCDDPEPSVRFTAFGDSSMDFALNFWVEEPALRAKALHAVNKAIYAAFAKEGIEIPFPQRDVHLKQHT